MTDKTIVGVIQKFIIENIRVIQDASQVPVEADLNALGMDSLAATNIMIDIEDHFSVVFTEELLIPDTFKSALSLGKAVESLLMK